MDLRPGGRVLEIGGGNGAAAVLICERVAPGGRLIAIDRSATATGRAAARNPAHVASGLASFETVSLAEHVPGEPVDVAVAMNVNLFWTGPAEREWAVLDRALRPRGASLFLCYGYGPGDPAGARDVTGRVGDALRGHGFEVSTQRSAETGCVAIVGRR